MSIVCKYYIIERFQCLSYFAEIKSSMSLERVNCQVIPSFFLLSSSKRRILPMRCGVYSRAEFNRINTVNNF